MSTVPTTCDLLIHSGEVIDGSGAARAHLDVAVTGDRIVAVGDHLDLHIDATSKIDASGLIVAPGFIDAHTHDDRAVLSGPDMTPKVSQGVTSVVTGNCGASLAPFAGREPPPPDEPAGRCVVVPLPDDARVHGRGRGIASGAQSRAVGRPYRVAGRGDG